MKLYRLAATAVALVLSLGSPALAESTLRIGLAEDPDILDPTMARTYVGRIVFSAFCDKLFDIDDKLNIVPQLALSHETSADGKALTIKLRPGVKFHDGEPFDAEAAKFSLERHMNFPGSFRKPELATVDHVDVVERSTSFAAYGVNAFGGSRFDDLKPFANSYATPGWQRAQKRYAAGEAMRAAPRIRKPSAWLQPAARLPPAPAVAA